jgi:glycosyltransferase involved in cell wall biosynthesis
LTGTTTVTSGCAIAARHDATVSVAGRVCVVAGRYPVASETFVPAEVAGLRRAGLQIRVEAAAHGDAGGPAPDACWADDSTADRLRALLWLVARHPRGVLADLRDRRRWRREEPVPPLRWLAPAARRIAARDERHLHAHFATGPALAALRLGQVLGRPFSVTAHAYDIFLAPANLREKLERAAFATSGCAYTVAALRDVAPDAEILEVVMGVDPDAFAPAPPRPEGGRAVVAVGRLVPKKGFADLVRAAGTLARAGRPLSRLTIAGDGPLRGELAALAAAEGVVLELPGAVAHDRVGALVGEHDVFCLPCVVAPDGDRDSMPVAVKEALAVEVPVVVTDEVGLPELVHDGWGRRVAPHDPAALAAALDELLALPAADRRSMGRAGRAHVTAHANVWTASARLAARLAASG